MSLQSLFAEATALQGDYYDEGADLWDGSVFAWIREYKPATVGAIGRRLARHIFQQAGIAVSQSGRYLSQNTYTVAVKFSMEWTAGGFVFEQIKDANYTHLFCLGIRPEEAYCWLIPRDEIISNGVWQTRDGLTGQHTGAGSQETAWLQVDPANVPQWLSAYGGSVQACEAVIAQTMNS